MKRLRLFVICLVSAMALFSPQAFAQYNSTNYQSNEVFFGSGGDPNQSSANYQAQSGVGALGVGSVSSSNYSARAGFVTPSVQYLEAFVNSGTVNMGILSTGSTSTGTSTFRVKVYQARGYAVRTVAAPPAYGAHQLTPLSTPTAATPGTEQFGMNLALNTSPSVGAAPAQAPDSTFGFGYATNGYQTPNLFKYVQNDIIAQSDSSSGETDYTISYIMNITNLTPGGTYNYYQDLVVTATY